MNTHHQTSLALLLATGLATAAPMKDRVTGEELSLRRTASPSPVSNLEKPDDSIQITRSSKESIISQSVILTDGNNWTLIPRGAVLHLPEQLQSHVGGSPVGNLLSWREFLTANRAWIGADEVTIRQAEGIQKLDPRRTAFWPKQGKIIIAVHKGGPISVAEEAYASPDTH